MKKAVDIVRILATLAILALAIYVALAPNVFYAPVPRVVLFLLVAILPATLLGADFAATFELKLPTVLISASLITGAIFALLFILNYLAKPEVQIAVFEVVDENNVPVALEFEGAVSIPPTTTGITITKYVAENTVVLIFPEQAPTVRMRVKKAPSENILYTGDVSYAGTRRLTLTLGTDLKPN